MKDNYFEGNNGEINMSSQPESNEKNQKIMSKQQLGLKQKAIGPIYTNQEQQQKRCWKNNFKDRQQTIEGSKS